MVDDDDSAAAELQESQLPRSQTQIGTRDHASQEGQASSDELEKKTSEDEPSRSDSLDPNTESLHPGPPPVPPQGLPTPPALPTLGPAPAVSQPKARVYLRMEAELKLQPAAKIDTPQGLRLKFDYQLGSSVYFFPQDDLNGQFDASTPGVIKGTILSGSDWVLVRPDGVLVFDARISVGFTEGVKLDKAGEPGYVMDATLKGLLDLGKRWGLSGPGVIEKLVRGEPSLGGKHGTEEWDASFSVRFEGSGELGAREDRSWLPKRLQVAIENAPQFKELLRQQFTAYAKVKVTQVPYYPPISVSSLVWGEP